MVGYRVPESPAVPIVAEKDHSDPDVPSSGRAKAEGNRGSSRIASCSNQRFFVISFAQGLDVRLLGALTTQLRLGRWQTPRRRDSPSSSSACFSGQSQARTNSSASEWAHCQRCKSPSRAAARSAASAPALRCSLQRSFNADRRSSCSRRQVWSAKAACTAAALDRAPQTGSSAPKRPRTADRLRARLSG